MQAPPDLLFPGEIALLDISMRESEVLGQTDQLDGTGMQVTPRGI